MGSSRPGSGDATERFHGVHAARDSIDDASLREQIRALLADGSLPRSAAGRIVAAYGDGTRCGACGLPMERDDVIYQLFFPRGARERSVVMHYRCYDCWDSERSE